MGSFVFLLIYALALFLAGVIVLPRNNVKNGEDAFSNFLRDGRWSLIAIAFYEFWAFLINPLLFDIEIINPFNLMSLLGIIILMVTFFGKSKRHWAVGTVVYCIYTVILIFFITPVQYQ